MIFAVLFPHSPLKGLGLQSFSFHFPSLDLALMGLFLAVVIDTYEEEFACVLRHFGGILATANLVDGGVCITVVFQLQDDGGRIDILSRD